MEIERVDVTANDSTPQVPPTNTTVAATETPTSSKVVEEQSPPPFPSPLAKYEDVVQDVNLFMHTLEKLHRFMGTRFMVPTIGGKSLDLHRLFAEVTSRGGLEKVIGDRKWKEVIAAFQFPSTITSASFVLRKYYLSLLHSYEQIYFLQTKQPIISASADASPMVKTQSCHRAKKQPGMITVVPAQATVADPLSNNSSDLPKKESCGPCGVVVKGVIKGKFENGYIITANYGSDVLKGFLYHVQPNEQQKPATKSAACIQKKRSRKAKDPLRPKAHRSGYNFFFAEQCASQQKPVNSREERAIQIGDKWNKLDAAEKEVYNQRGVQDVERYRIEMLEYKKTNLDWKQPH